MSLAHDASSVRLGDYNEDIKVVKVGSVKTTLSGCAFNISDDPALVKKP